MQHIDTLSYDSLEFLLFGKVRVATRFLSSKYLNWRATSDCMLPFWSVQLKDAFSSVFGHQTQDTAEEFFVATKEKHWDWGTWILQLQEVETDDNMDFVSLITAPTQNRYCTRNSPHLQWESVWAWLERWFEKLELYPYQKKHKTKQKNQSNNACIFSCLFSKVHANALLIKHET